MEIISFRDRNFIAELAALEKASLFDPKIEADAQAIIAAVRRDGDAALCRFAKKFDQVRIRSSQLRVTPSEIRAAKNQITPKARQALTMAHKNIHAFALGSLRSDWQRKNKQGGKVGERFVSLQRVGIHIPGASKPLVSTVLMTVTLAKAAGVREIVVCNPVAARGECGIGLNPAVLYACEMAGATEIYRVGGAQAIAAMTFGTKTLRPVDKIFGPGNAWTVAAKRLLFGYVGIDLLPGPSELLVIADDSANANYIAADLLAQAEHGSGHERVFLVSLSPRGIAQVQNILRGNPLARLCHLILVGNREQAVQITNRLAPEHVELMVHNPKPILRQIRTAGAVFLGPYSPTVLGDYLAGPSHTLPTGGSGRAFSGLTADQFQRRMSVIEYDRTALQKSLPALNAFGAMEGLSEHARSARIRFS